MRILLCPNCQIRVAVNEDGRCPGCRKIVAMQSGEAAPTLNSRSVTVAFPEPTLTNNLESNVQETPAPTHFDLLVVWFSLRGRIPRSVYWLATIAGFYLLFIGLAVATGLSEQNPVSGSLLSFLLLALFGWALLAINAKRFHDLGWSGFWCFLLLIPGVGYVVAFFVLGLQPGTRGENQFGTDPLKLFL